MNDLTNEIITDDDNEDGLNQFHRDLLYLAQTDDPFIEILAGIILDRGEHKLLERHPSQVPQYELTMASYINIIRKKLKEACEYYPV